VIKGNSDRIWSILFILPSIILIGIFVYGFISWTGYVSLSEWRSLIPNYSFAGFENYLNLFKDFRFQADIRNTIFFTILFIGAVAIMGQILAVLIDQNIKVESIFRNLFLFPMALSFVVTGVVWQWLLNPSTGVNLLLEKIGLSPEWYVSTDIIPGLPIGKIEFGIPVAMVAIVIAAVWQMTGFSLAMYLAGLRGIPEELKEAARIDGASEWKLYRKIIFPQLRPITMSVIIIMAHISLKIFDLIYAMTGPGANYVTDVPALYMFETTFRANNYASGAAIAMILLISVAVFIIPYLMVNRRED